MAAPFELSPVRVHSRSTSSRLSPRTTPIRASLTLPVFPSPPSPARTQAALRNLADKMYEKRKVAALEVERVARACARADDAAKLDALVERLAVDFAASPNPNQRKGGLIGLAAVSLGLGADDLAALPTVVPPILAACTDPDARVRYYACEAMYNVAKVSRRGFLPFFPVTFDALCKLSADADADVQNAAHLLDRLVKDIVAESGSFDVRAFAPMLRERITILNPYVRQFLVGWISALDSAPDIDMLACLPDMLDGLLHMLSDPNREIRQQADSALGDFLAEIRAGGEEAATRSDLGRLTSVLVARTRSADEFTRVTAVTWLREFVSLAGRAASVGTHVGTPLVSRFADILGAVLPCLSHAEPKVRDVAEKASDELLAAAVDAARADEEMTMSLRERSEKAEKTPPKPSPSTSSARAATLDLPGVFSSLARATRDGAGEPTMLASLRWYAHLVDAAPARARSLILRGRDVSDPDDSDSSWRLSERFSSMRAILSSLSHESCEVATRGVTALAALARGDDDDFDAAVRALVAEFAAGQTVSSETRMDGEVSVVAESLLRRRGATALRRLCAELGSERTLVRLADVIVDWRGDDTRAARDGDGDGLELETDADSETASEARLAFSAAAAEAMNLILLTAPECADARRALSREGGSSHLFRALFPCWCHAPVAAMALCLLSRAHHLAWRIALALGHDETETTVATFVQIDQLVHLLESPAFAGLRLRLATPEMNIKLYRALYALLMILPQSAAFRTLRARLDAVPRKGEGSVVAERLGGRSELEDDVRGDALARLEATLYATRERHIAAARARERRSWTATPF